MDIIIELTEDTIRNRCVAENTYTRGLSYYKLRKVLDITELVPSKLFHSTVEGRLRKYQQRFEFDKHGILMRSTCDCSAFASEPGHCKHIVAALFAVKDHVENVVITKQDVAEEVRQMIEYYQQSTVVGREYLQLDVTFHYERMFRNKAEKLCYLSIKIGSDRMYVVSSLEKFLEAVYHKQEYAFTKLFTYVPWEQGFRGKDEQVMDLLLEIFEYEQTAAKASYAERKMFQGKRVMLSERFVLRLFAILQGSTINVEIEGVYHQDTPVFAADLPIQLNLVEVDEGLELVIHSQGDIQPIFANSNLFFYQEMFYLISDRQQQQLQPVLSSLKKLQSDRMLIPKSYIQPFVSGAMQKLKQAGRLHVDASLEKRMLKTPLKVQVFMDYHEGSITCNLEYRYEDIRIHPFAGNGEAVSDSEDRILIRDTEKEQQVMAFFERQEFQYNGKTMYIEDEQRMFEFLSKHLSELQRYADVYYSEQFRKIQSAKHPKVRGRIGLNAAINVLEVSFELEGVDRKELMKIFNAIKEKKNYYRLKDGAFISLSIEDVEEMNDLAMLAEELHLTSSDWSKETMQLPLHQVLLIDELGEVGNSPRWMKDDRFQELVHKIKNPVDVTIPLAEHLETIMRPYQKMGFQWFHTLANYGFGGILADDMGLGKTLQAISYILSLKMTIADQRPALVIAPTSLVYNWQSEFATFAKDLNVVVIAGSQSERQEQLIQMGQADVIVTSYPLVRRDIEAYEKLTFCTCILDEAQFLKNHTTITAQAVKRIQTKNFFALTGTPIENSITDLWSIFNIVLPGFFPPIKQFQRLYGEDTLGKLHKRVKPFIFRRIKKDVLQELPDKIENKLISALTIDQKKLYLAYLEHAKGQIASIIQQDGFHKGQIKILAALTRLRQICCHPALFVEDYQGESGKLLQLQEILSDMLVGGHRILIFSQFSSMLKLIREVIDQAGYNYHYLDGSTPARERTNMAARFNEGEGDMFLISLKAGGTGLNLTGADTVILYDLWWNPAVEDQAADRAHRIGQEKVVQVIRLIAQGTIEEKIFELQQKKRDMIDQVIQSGETLLTKLSEQEIRELLT